MKPIFTKSMTSAIVFAGCFISAMTNMQAQNCTAEVPASVDTTSAAYNTVVTADNFCCTIEWDQVCQNAYDAATNGGTGTGGTVPLNDTCVTPPSNVDVNSDAYLQVIANDYICCNVFWDALCQNAYDQLTGVEPGDCVIPPPNVDISSDAYNHVITTWDYCCSVQWDWICNYLYNNAPFPNNANGCASTPAMVDTSSAAYTTVINEDPFCCNVQWDNICQNAYNLASGMDGGIVDTGGNGNGGIGTVSPGLSPENGNCATVPPGVDVTSDIYAQVIDNDSFCCNTAWDFICQTAYDILTDPDSITCVEVPEGVDTESEAYLAVIADDPFCCNSSWDIVCQNAYDNYSPAGSGLFMGSASGNEIGFGLGLFPNPAVSTVNLTFSNIDSEAPVVIEVFSSTGQAVLKAQVVVEGLQQHVLDIAGLSSGLYLVSARQDNQLITKQLLIQK